MTLDKYDKAIRVMRDLTGDALTDGVCEEFAQILEGFRKGHAEIVDELFNMYKSASEHNVDVGRDAIFEFGIRLVGAETVDSLLDKLEE
jgi:hypothetical protein